MKTEMVAFHRPLSNKTLKKVLYVSRKNTSREIIFEQYEKDILTKSLHQKFGENEEKKYKKALEKLEMLVDIEGKVK